ncbi:MAG TPA: MarR family transcriptional regulator [Candidatus Dormibacteraeota bacterium]|nr:MarR family transcriptional regulator [Candidatus Dormibacteraeota bacterium]
MQEKLETNIDCGPDGLFYDRRVREFLDPSPAPDRLAGETLAALRAASHSLRHRMDRWLDRHSLSESRLALIVRLNRVGEITLGDLAEALDVTPRNVTGLVDHLERDGLVERFPDPDDRRATRVRLSPAGAAKLAELGTEKGRSTHDLVAGMTDEELAQLRHLLLKLVKSMSATAPKELERV